MNIQIFGTKKSSDTRKAERWFKERRIKAQVIDLLDKGILSKCQYGVKILGNGSLSKKLTVQANAFSESAKAKIEEAGGKAEVV